MSKGVAFSLLGGFALLEMLIIPIYKPQPTDVFAQVSKVVGYGLGLILHPAADRILSGRRVTPLAERQA